MNKEQGMMNVEVLHIPSTFNVPCSPSDWRQPGGLARYSLVLPKPAEHIVADL